MRIDFYSNYIRPNSVAGAAGGYYANDAISPDDCMFMRILHGGSSKTVCNWSTERKSAAWAWWKKSFRGYTGYGHGGDLGLTSGAMVFSRKRRDCRCINNDAKIIHGTGACGTKLLKNLQYLVATTLPWRQRVCTSWSSTPNPPRLRLFLTWLMGWQRQNMESAFRMVMVRFSGNHPHKTTL